MQLLHRRRKGREVNWQWPVNGDQRNGRSQQALPPSFKWALFNALIYIYHGLDGEEGAKETISMKKNSPLVGCPR